jgi:hypothetical protein
VVPEPETTAGCVDRLLGDERVGGVLADLFRRNTRHEDGSKRMPGDAEVALWVRTALVILLDPGGVGLADVGGLRLILERSDDGEAPSGVAPAVADPGPASDVVHASAWDGGQWRPVAHLPLALPRSCGDCAGPT